jgi:uncharacterized protein (DUF305 family)
MKLASLIAAAALLLLPITLPPTAFAQEAGGHDMHNMNDGAKPATNPATQAYMKAMNSMHTGMQSMTPTNDPNKDFVLMMKPHHQAAVDMAQTYLKYGSDPKLKKMARAIVRSQKKEIAEMTAWESRHGMGAK